jgi:hypothetical protein
MANPLDPFALNVEGVRQLVENKTNKKGDGVVGDPEGAASEKYDVLDLKMSDQELLKLRDEYEKRYAPYESKIKPIFDRNKESYLGKKADGQWLGGDDNIAANLQFEAEETFLAAALSKNPEPVVYSDNTPEGNEVSGAVKTMLAFHADELAIRRKLCIAVRQWSIYHLGVLKYGWDKRKNDVCVENRKIQDFVFDPNGYVDAEGNFTSWLGERITVTAEKLIELYPKHAAYITLVVDGRLGTDCVYTEWWTDEFCFITFKEVVLDKHKNEFYRYNEPIMEGGEPQMDEFGNVVETDLRNHFATPKKPYGFLSVYTLQEQPHDITGLIEQNIPNQKRITRQTDQIDRNIATSNNGFAFSEDNFNQETAKQAANARKVGNPILIPSGGPIEKAILPLPAQDIPAGFFNALEMHKNDLRMSWGVQGITAEPQDEDQTARGMILNQSHDTSRIGGGIGSAVEGLAKNAFNWLTQLYYVFYDEKHFAAIMGNAKAVEYVTLSAADMDRQLIVTVSPDSMKPKDDITNINLAQALFDKGAIGPKTLLKMVDFPNPDESAADGVLYRLDPMAYFQTNFPEEFAKMQQSQMEQAQIQMAQQAQGQAMGAQVGLAGAPEENTEPEKNVARDPASAALSQVPLPA